MKRKRCTSPSSVTCPTRSGIEASKPARKSIEHFTGVFEGCSTQEDELLKGPKGTLACVVSTYHPCAGNRAHQSVCEESDLAGSYVVLGARPVADRRYRSKPRSPYQICSAGMEGPHLAHVHQRYFERHGHRPFPCASASCKWNSK